MAFLWYEQDSICRPSSIHDGSCRQDIFLLLLPWSGSSESTKPLLLRAHQSCTAAQNLHPIPLNLWLLMTQTMSHRINQTLPALRLPQRCQPHSDGSHNADLLALLRALPSAVSPSVSASLPTTGHKLWSFSTMRLSLQISKRQYQTGRLNVC